MIGAGSEVGDEVGLGGIAGEGIEDEDIGALAAGEGIVAEATDEDVVAVLAIKEIVGVVAGEGVVERIAGEIEQGGPGLGRIEMFEVAAQGERGGLGQGQ